LWPFNIGFDGLGEGFVARLHTLTDECNHTPRFRRGEAFIFIDGEILWMVQAAILQFLWN
jgi:hypothetical protein